MLRPGLPALVVGLALAPAFAGCLEGGGPAGTAPIDEPVRTLAWGARTGVAGEREAVLASEADWAALWREHVKGGDAKAPAVDFAKERVVAVALGERGNGCFGVRVVAARTVGATTTVNVTERTPQPDEFCTQALVTPFHFVAIPKREADVAFAWRVGTFELPPGETPQDPGEPMEPGAVAWRPVAAGQHSGVEDARRVVIGTEAEYAALWDEHAAFSDPRPERPAVDFSKERVTAAFLGPKGDACWHADVQDVARDGDRLVVTLVIVKPAAGQACADVITHPFVLVALPRGEETVEWKDVEREA